MSNRNVKISNITLGVNSTRTLAEGETWYTKGGTTIEKSKITRVISMYGMFLQCDSLESVDVSNFNTSKVTDMGSMFYGCTSLLNLDLSNFDTRLIERSGPAQNDVGAILYTGLAGFPGNCNNLETIILNLNFGQFDNITAAGSELNMFYASSNVYTMVTGANNYMDNDSYGWGEDNHTVTFN